MESHALITNDATVFGILAVVLGLIFHTAHSENPFFKKFYKVVPALLMCYFIPGLLNSMGIIDAHHSKLYFVSSRYLLPAALVLLTLNIDLKGIINLGPKAIIMFLTATVGVMVGGPIAVFVTSFVKPELIGVTGPEAVWRGLTTVAGSWIGGGANQAAMKEVFQVGGDIFSMMIAVDVMVASVWMAILLFLAGRYKQIDARTGADGTALEELRIKLEDYSKKHSKIPTLTDLMKILMVAFGSVGLSHFVSDNLVPVIKAQAPVLAKFSMTSGFFWLIVIATAIGVCLSFTKARQLEGAGASKVGSVFVYILVASIGMHMDVTKIFNQPALFFIGFVWIIFHAVLLLIVGKLIKAPLFFLAVGSQANIGGAASAPVVAGSFHPTLAPVGVLLAVLGYALGTYGAIICGHMMRIASGQ